MILRARWLVPVSSPPVENGAILIEGNRIENIFHGLPAGGAVGMKDVIDLGDSILIPGLLNAHCHLEYTHLAGLIQPPESFTNWLQKIVEAKQAASSEEFTTAARKGAEMLLENGVTTVANTETANLNATALGQNAPRILPLLELISVNRNDSALALIDAAESCLEQKQSLRQGLSPHAAYTTDNELLARAASRCQRRNWILSSHVAESEEEFLMFTEKRGPLYAWLAHVRSMSAGGGITPLENFISCGALDGNFLAVHLNYLSENDLASLRNRQLNVVHCPRSHEYFGHHPFPYQELLSTGARISLGTDSLASLGTTDVALDLFAEMQTFHRHHPGASPETILQMTTLIPAASLGLPGHLGELCAGALADVVALPWQPGNDIYETIVYHSGAANMVMIEGQIVFSGKTGNSPDSGAVYVQQQNPGVGSQARV